MAANWALGFYVSAPLSRVVEQEDLRRLNFDSV